MYVISFLKRVELDASKYYSENNFILHQKCKNANF